MNAEWRGEPDMQTQVTAPCKDCPKRHPLCHSDCPEYLSFRERLAEFKKAQKAHEIKQNGVGGFLSTKGKKGAYLAMRERHK